jgi:hypothetical protein
MATVVASSQQRCVQHGAYLDFASVVLGWQGGQLRLRRLRLGSRPVGPVPDDIADQDGEDTARDDDQARGRKNDGEAGRFESFARHWIPFITGKVGRANSGWRGRTLGRCSTREPTRLQLGV